MPRTGAARAAPRRQQGPSILEVMADEHLLGPSFKDQASWERWRVCLAAMFGLAPPKCESIDPVEFYRQHTGRTKWPLGILSTMVSLIVGRRGGKSRISAAIGVYLACFRDYTAYLSPGEVGVVMVIAADRRQARVAFRYIKAMVTNTPMLAELVSGETAESITLTNAFGNAVCIEVHTASFKSTRGYALALDTPIATPDGFKPMGEIEVGDVVFDEAGQPTTVTAVFDRMPEQAFRLTFDDGSVIEADAEHQWVTWDFLARQGHLRHGLQRTLGPIPPNWPQWNSLDALPIREHGRPLESFGPRQRSTLEISRSLMAKSMPNCPNHAIPNSAPLRMAERALAIDPYLFGVWLGDGTTTDGSIATDFANGDAGWVMNAFRDAGFPSRQSGQHRFIPSGFKAKLRALGTLGNKNIPPAYLWASVEQRTALLQGLMDTDGHSVTGTRKVEFVSIREDHAQAVAFLARSLGQKPTIKRKKKTEGYAGQPFFFNVRWTSTINPFRLPRKAKQWQVSRTRQLRRVMTHSIVACEQIAPKPMRCLTVDSPNSMYLCGEALIPTHNTVLAAICDEIAFWNTDGANPDEEIISAIDAATATIPDAMIVMISSPHTRHGVLYQAYKDHFGDHGDPQTFVWQAPTRDMNPSVRQSFIDKRYARDPAKADAEYGANFRSDIEKFVSEAVVMDCTPVKGCIAIPPAEGITYKAFVDPSGGSSDAMTCAIGHRTPEGTIVHDAHMTVKAPFKPTEAIAAMKPLLKQYRVTRVSGDHYGGEWPREGFQKEGIEYEVHGRSKSQLYVDLIPHLTSRTVRLLDTPDLGRELWNLERRKSPSGRELIDHPKGGHDDNANAVAGMVDLLAKQISLRPVWGSGTRSRAVG